MTELNSDSSSVVDINPNEAMINVEIDGVNTQVDLKSVFNKCCEIGELRTLKFVYKKYHKNYSIYNGINTAHIYHHSDIVEWLVNLPEFDFANFCNHFYFMGIDIIKHVVETFPQRCNIIEGVYTIYKTGGFVNKILKLLMSKYVASDYPNIYEHLLRLALDRDDHHMQRIIYLCRCEKYVIHIYQRIICENLDRGRVRIFDYFGTNEIGDETLTYGIKWGKTNKDESADVTKLYKRVMNFIDITNKGVTETFFHPTYSRIITDAVLDRFLPAIFHEKYPWWFKYKTEYWDAIRTVKKELKAELTTDCNIVKDLIGIILDYVF
jgi:hypothetical protein